MTERIEYIRKLCNSEVIQRHDDFFYVIEDEDGNTIIFNSEEVEE
jgi:hypothetical protein